MAARTITLPDHVVAWIDEQVAEGKFTSEDDVIVELVEQAMSPRINWNDDPGVQQSIAEIERGEGILITDISAFFDEVSRRASEAAARGDVVPDDIKY